MTLESRVLFRSLQHLVGSWRVFGVGAYLRLSQSQQSQRCSRQLLHHLQPDQLVSEEVVGILQTWPFPIIRGMTRGSSASELVASKSYDEALIDYFVDVGTKLAQDGCVGIIASCGLAAVARPL